MALNYTQLVAAAADPTFQSRVRASLLTAAINIAVDSPPNSLEVKRDAAARDILRNPDLWTIRFSLPVALGFGTKSNATLTDATDAEIDTRVASVYNDVACSPG